MAQHYNKSQYSSHGLRDKAISLKPTKIVVLKVLGCSFILKEGEKQQRNESVKTMYLKYTILTFLSRNPPISA